MSKKLFVNLLFSLVAVCLMGMSLSCSDDEDETLVDNEEKVDPSGEEQEQEQKNPGGKDGIVKILCIGNSFSRDAVEQNLFELFDAAGMEAVIGNLYIAGCTLETHYNNSVSNSAAYSYRKVVGGNKTTSENYTLLNGILNENWDYISLQQASPDSGLYDSYNPYLANLIKYVQENATNEDMKIVFHQTWAYGSDYDSSNFAPYGYNQMTMYNAINDVVRQIVAENPEIEIVVPSGTAVQNARNTWMGDNFNSDGRHLETTYGRFTAACAWFEELSGIDVTTTKYTPSGVSSSIKDLVTHAAHYAVQDPYNVNPMTEWQTDPAGGDLVPLTAPSLKVVSTTYGHVIIEWELSDEALVEQASAGSEDDMYSYRLLDANGEELRLLSDHDSYAFAKYPNHQFVWGGLEPNTTYSIAIRREPVGFNTSDYTSSDWVSVSFTTEADPVTNRSDYLLYYDFENVPFGGGGPYGAYGSKVSLANDNDYSDPNSLHYVKPGSSNLNYVYTQTISDGTGFNESFFDNYLPGTSPSDFTNSLSSVVSLGPGYMRFGASSAKNWFSLPALSGAEDVVLEMDAMVYIEPSSDGDMWTPSNAEMTSGVDADHFTIDVGYATVTSVSGDTADYAVIASDGHSVVLKLITVAEMKEMGLTELKWTNFKVSISGLSSSDRIKILTDQTTYSKDQQRRMWVNDIMVSKAE